MSSIIILCIIGIIIGAAWFIFMERFDKTKLSLDCWEKLHYMDKEQAPLWLVHLKSFAAGLVLIALAMSDFQYKNEIVGMIGGGIIGVHLCQFVNEMNVIDTKHYLY